MFVDVCGFVCNDVQETIYGSGAKLELPLVARKNPALGVVKIMNYYEARLAKAQEQAGADNLPCGSCGGSGVSRLGPYTAWIEGSGPGAKMMNGVSAIPVITWDSCRVCGGAGSVKKPDFEAMVEKSFTVRGGRRLRASKPNADARTQAFWRFMRFHSGADPSMPFLASMDLHGDPYSELIQVVAEEFCRQGNGLTAGENRWARALGINA